MFVCLGNIVRSPLAQAICENYIGKAGMGEDFIVDSAGTGSWHVGESPDLRMQKVAASHGLHYTHQARQVKPSDLEFFNLILVMDQENYASLSKLAKIEIHREKIRFLREWDPSPDKFLTVPDPYYDDMQSFNDVFNIIDRSVQKLVESLIVSG